MPHPTAVILVVGLTRSVIGDHTPRLAAFTRAGVLRTLTPAFPAVTCSVQAGMTTGAAPAHHGIVGNGWYDRALGEVHFWKQSSGLVESEKVWETARRRDPSVTTASICWWFNMHTTADFALTPRPQYTADGRKIPDCWTRPADLRDHVQSRLGPFPLFNFWGPGASIASSRWISGAARLTLERHNPTLSLIYLPHLDYAHQKFGPHSPRSRAAEIELDAVVGDLLDDLSRRGTRCIILSEYGIEPVDRPVLPNRALREAGFLTVRREIAGEILDLSASRAFAVCDHQAAHVYIRDPADLPAVADLLRSRPGVQQVLDSAAMAACHIRHRRSGDLLLMSEPGAWFAYPYWLDDAHAPDFARTVDIHRKPGYDPCELFIDPRIAIPRLAIARRLLARRLGFRSLMDIIPLNPAVVRGSHGRVDQPEPSRPIIITHADRTADTSPLPCTAVRDVILDHLFN